MAEIPRARIPDDAQYLLTPIQGYPLAVPAATEAVLDAAHRELVQNGSTAEAVRVSSELLQRQPNLAPATVLAAQAALVDGEYSRALESLRHIVEEYPDFDAANMIVGRAAEHLQFLAEALIAYGSAADASPLAAARFRDVMPKAVTLLAGRVKEALDRSRLDAARANLAILKRWAPREVETLRSEAAVAVAHGDGKGELEALRELTALGSVTEDVVLRRARLELEVGDAGAGLRIFQDLAAKQPDNGRLAAELARAKFLWRLELLPEKVKDLSREPQLRRGELAAMLYWLFPSVRYGRPESGKIANDVLNHPHRQEIVRVANLGIMSVDPRLHRFAPDSVLSRAATIVPILRILGRHRPLPACLSGHDVSMRMSSELACELGFRCGLLDEEGECLPNVESSGAAAIEWTRRALDNLGVE